MKSIETTPNLSIDPWPFRITPKFIDILSFTDVLHADIVYSYHWYALEICKFDLEFFSFSGRKRNKKYKKNLTPSPMIIISYLYDPWPKIQIARSGTKPSILKKFAIIHNIFVEKKENIQENFLIGFFRTLNQFLMRNFSMKFSIIIIETP